MKIPRVSVVLKTKSLLGCILTLKSLSPRSPRDDADVELELELLTPEAAQHLGLRCAEATFNQLIHTKRSSFSDLYCYSSACGVASACCG